MATFQSNGLLPTLDLTFVGATDPFGFDPRSGTVWTVLGPENVVVDTTLEPQLFPETYWYIYGTGLDADPLSAFPTQGTITNLYQIVPLDDTPAPAEEKDLLVSWLFFSILDLNMSAQTFRDAVFAGTLNELIYAGDDLFIGYSSLTQHMLGPANIQAGAGNDSVYASGKDDSILGGTGDDLIKAATTDTTLFQADPGGYYDGGEGDDTVIGGGRRDTIIGAEGGDLLSGDKGHDLVSSGQGRDRVYGGIGNDTVIVSAGETPAGEILDGGADSDRLMVFATGPAADLSDAGISNFETLDLQGSARMTRGQFAGFDRVEFNGFLTLTFTDSGLIDLPGMVACWYVVNPLATLTIQAGDGRDVINGRDSYDVVGPDGALTGYGARDLLRAGAGDDVANGGSGGDQLWGEAGNDLLRGGGGSDLLNGGTGLDTASYDTAATGVVVNLAFSGLNTGDALGDVLIEVENLAGSGFADSLTGDAGANVLTGRNGADLLTGLEGADTLLGGDGNDRLLGGLGGDLLTGGAGRDRFLFKAFAESRLSPDTISDFSQAQGDVIDLAGLVAGELVFNGKAGPSGGGKASVWFGEGAVAGTTAVHVDNGNGGADEMTIILTGSVTLTAADFAL